MDEGLEAETDRHSGSDTVCLWVSFVPFVSHCGMRNIAKSDAAIITPNEVQQAVAYLCEDKTTGSDSFAAEHLMYAGQKESVLLATCFSGFVS